MVVGAGAAVINATNLVARLLSAQGDEGALSELCAWVVRLLGRISILFQFRLLPEWQRDAHQTKQGLSALCLHGMHTCQSMLRLSVSRGGQWLLCHGGGGGPLCSMLTVHCHHSIGCSWRQDMASGLLQSTIQSRPGACCTCKHQPTTACDQLCQHT